MGEFTDEINPLAHLQFYSTKLVKRIIIPCDDSLIKIIMMTLSIASI